MTPQHDIFQNRHIPEQLHCLKRPGNAPLGDLVGFEMFDGQPLECYRSIGGRKGAGNDIEKGCLPCAVGTDNRLDHSFFYFETEMTHSH